VLGSTEAGEARPRRGGGGGEAVVSDPHSTGTVFAPASAAGFLAPRSGQVHVHGLGDSWPHGAHHCKEGVLGKGGLELGGEGGRGAGVR